TFKLQILKVYRPSLDQTLLKMEQRQKLSNELVMEYYYDKLHLCLQTDPNMSPPMIIHYLIKGLNPSLISYVVRRHPSTPAEFLVIAQDEEKIQQMLQGLTQKTVDPHADDDDSNDKDPGDETIALVQRSTYTKSRSFNSPQQQRITSTPQPLMNSHFVYNQPSYSTLRYNRSNPTSTFTSRQCYVCHGFDGDTSWIKKTPSSSYLSSYSSSIKVPVNNYITKVLVDTGAALSLIHEKTLQCMRHYSITSCSLKEVHTANSGFISLLGLVNLKVKINHIITTVDAYVTRDLVCPMILGRDWIQKHHVNINFSTNRIYIYDSRTSVPLLPVSSTEPLTMLLEHSIVIPPFHEKFIPGYVPIHSLLNVVFTPNLALQKSKLILIPHSVLHIRDYHGIISIKNNIQRPKTIPRHTPLGSIIPSSEDLHINTIPEICDTTSHFSSSPLPLFSCIHCAVACATETDLYEHLLACCNNHSTCTTTTIDKFVEHIDDSFQRMKAYLMLHQYYQLFDVSSATGITCTPQRAINTGSHAPLAVHPRRVSHLNRQIINDQVKNMLDNEIISPSTSPWASPVVIVKKHDGSPRFCIDYRQLNYITQKDVYPLPRIDDVLERLNGSNIFSKLDLRSGYFQVPLAPDEREKTAFITHDGLWQFNRLPQGFKNFTIYDIVVYSSSFAQHLIDLNKVCAALNNSNFKLNHIKCSFFQNNISFLGHHISVAGCLPNNDNIRAIMQFPIPLSGKAAYSFLQMVGFYRKFIPRFAQISSPLNKFNRKGIPFIWTDIEQSAFDQLKAAITSPAVLIFPDPNKIYIIRTDASRVGIGAVLLQKQVSTNNKTTPVYKPIAFASRTLKAAETRYSTIELETLAIWWNALSRYPVDQPDVIDDTEPHYITSSTQTDNIFINAVVTRSMTRKRQSPANLSIQQQQRAKLCSNKAPVESSTSSIKNIQIYFDDDTLAQRQNEDPDIQKIKYNHKLNPNYIIDKADVLFRIVKRKFGQHLNLRYLPASLIPKVLSAYHNSTFAGAHFGIKRTFYKIRDRFYWPHIKPDGHLQSIEPPHGVWERLAMDYVGPVPESKSGNKYFLVLTDLFSKFVVTKAVSNNTSITAARFLLYDVFMTYGVPLEIITDNGCHFTSSLYESLIRLAGCCHIKTTPYNPQANGQCERHNATLVPNLIALSNRSKSDWDQQLIPTAYNYNTTRHDSTGYAPFELMFARAPRFIFDFLSPPSIPSNAKNYRQQMNLFLEHTLLAARNHNIHHQVKAKQRYDSNRSDPQYYIGQRVVIRNPNPKDKQENLCCPKYGPQS
ncbi:unnamed protein product, partial [Rotaria sp. Silwood2]